MNIHRKLIERITITGPQEDAQKAFKYCEKHGFWVTRSGPMPKANHRVDVTRFKIIAEREVELDGGDEK